MKKSVILLSLFLLLIYSCDFKDLDDDNPVGTEDKSIEVVSPDGGDEIMVGESYTIRWNSDITDQLIIQYSVDNGNNWITIADSLQNSGNYVWTPIPNKISNNVRVKVSSLDGSVYDISENKFKIIENTKSLIILTSPNGGETLNLGSTSTITWVSSKVDYIKIEFSADNGDTWEVITNRFSAGISQFEWDPVPSVYSTQCLIRISMTEDESLFDQSSTNFSILVAEGVNMLVLSPNGGEAWDGGSHQELKWFSRNVDKVNIEYTNNNGVEWNTIATNVQNTGIYYWNPVPSVPSTLSKIRITDANDNAKIDESDDVFTIAPEPQISVVAPNGGESLQAGTSNNISWTSTNIAAVKLEYTINNGAEWFTIIDSTESDGNFSWENIPDVNSSLCRIRISDVKDGNPIDISDENFTIFNQITQLINIVLPNGNEEWQSATSQTITWESTGIDSVKIEYTVNNGINWVLLEEKIASSGSYEWKTPDVKSTQVKVRISDANDNLPSDESDDTFTLKQAGSITLLSPKAGEVWEAGREYEIKWESENVENVLIEYTTINGKYEPEAPPPWEDDYYEIVKSAPAGTGSYKVIFSEPSNQYKIRVGDAEFGSPADFSGLFTVSPQPFDSLIVVSPNGGEDWLTDETYEIRWMSFNVDRVNIDYTLDNDNWISIAADVVSNGLYNWTIPSSVDFRSDNCKIRVSSAQDTAKYDVSDNFFSIHPQEKLLRLINPNGTEGEDLPNLIRWESAGITHVKLEYTVNNGIDWVVIVNKVESSGLYEWDIPQVPSSLCRVRITDVSNDAGSNPLTDQSDSFFSINGGSTLTLLTPNGEETLQSGANYEIRWTSQNVEKVKIEYTLTNGPVWTTIVDSTVSDGSYIWDPVPDSQSKQCRIRISNARDKNHYDISDANFEITTPDPIEQKIEVTSPNGGEEWEGNTTQTITWLSDAIDNVNIHYSLNNGQSWTSLATNIPNNGSYEWTLPKESSSQCKIRVSDASDNKPFDENDVAFTIKPVQNISIIAPESGVTITSGDKVKILWESTGIENVQIDYTIFSGFEEQDWTPIVPSTPADGEFEHIFSEPSETYKIRIMDADDRTPMAVSGQFIVKPRLIKYIKVTAPYGDEEWLTGRTYEIRWQAQFVNSVKLEYTLDNLNWNTIEANVNADKGRYMWTIPSSINFNTELCKIRVSDIEDETVNDISSGFFKIYGGKLLRVLFPNGYEKESSGDGGAYGGGGEYICIGEKGNITDTLITWEQNDKVTAVKIEVTVDDGASWILIHPSAPAVGAYYWHFVSIPTYSTQARIRLTDVSPDAGSNPVSDESDRNFNLNICEGVAMFNLNRGETLKSGDSQEIYWTGSEDISSVKLEYSTNGGKSWNIISDDVPSKATIKNKYLWKNIPEVSSSNVKIRVSAGKYKATSSRLKIVK